MAWKPKKIPTLKGSVWSVTAFEKKEEFLEYVQSQFKEPGKYNLKDTYLWRQPAINFEKHKRFCNHLEDSEDYKKFWAFEKKKIGQGVIINDFYVPGDFYWYLNFTPIVDKVKAKEDFAELWDGDYHFYLYGEIARLVGLNEAVTKARQKGFEQPNSEPVLTETGFRPMGELKVGDKVYSKDGKLTEVVEVFPQGLKDVYEVEFLDDRKVRCGLEHLWEVNNRVIGLGRIIYELQHGTIFYLPKIERIQGDKLHEQCLEKKGYEQGTIKSVTKLDYQEESTCIQVANPSHIYITTDFIPTHNSLKIVSKLIRKLWFVPQSVSKMIGFEEDHVNTNGSWKFAANYRNFLNEHTPWYRDFEPDGVLEWEQKKTVIEGVTNTKKKFEGLRSRLVAATTKKSPSKAVGGLITDLFHEEAGIAPNLDKVLEFAEAATKMGGVKTGHIIVSGAVGELKDCAPLEAIAFSPEKHGFLGVKDIWSEVPSEELVCFFFPDYWNYLAVGENGEQVKCYDEDGNSDIELAKEYLMKEDTRQKGKDNYILWKSQHPWNLQEAFAIREDNIFPTRIIKEHQTQLRQTYTPLTVNLIENDGSITHEISYDKPVMTLKIDPMKDNRGVIEIDELPIDNPPWGLYYAGVDPIRQTNTMTSKSLMSVYIFKASHVNSQGKLVNDFPVARYTGRYDSWEETYEVCMRLCRFYNSRIAVENNVTGFHEWAIRKNLGHMFMHRKEIHLINEWMPNSTIQNEIGIRMEGEFKKKALDFAVAYVDEIISTYEKDGERHHIYGVSRLRDIMLLEEMLKFTPKLNTDRIISFTLGLIAARSATNRNLIVKERESNYQPSNFTKLSKSVRQPQFKLPNPLKGYKGIK